MQPIVVYDVQGTRHWKAKEQARREAKRSLSLSRSLHEARRQARLQQVIEGIRGTLERLEVDSKDEPGDLRAADEMTRLSQGILEETQETLDQEDVERASDVDEAEAEEEAAASAEEVATTIGETQLERFDVEASSDVDEKASTAPRTEIAADEADARPHVESRAAEASQETLERLEKVEEHLAVNKAESKVPLENDDVRPDYGPDASTSPRAQTDASTSNDVVTLSAMLTSLQDQLASESRPPQRKALRSKMQAAADVVIGRQVPASDVDIELIEEDDDLIEVQPIEPSEEYSETPRQLQLTADENVMLEDAIRGLAGDALDLPAELGRLHTSALDLAASAQSVAITYDTSLSTPSAEDHRQTRELLAVMGVPLLEAEPPYEAEGVASAMAVAGFVEFVGTEDTDVLAYQAPLLRNVATNDRPLELVDGTRLRSEVGLSAQAFIDWILLCGTDATSRIYRVGNHKALKLIQESGSIEEILETRPQLKTLAGREYYHDVLLGRQVFGELPPIPSVDLTQRPTPAAEVRAYLARVHGLSVQAEPTSVDDLADAYEVLEDLSEDLGPAPEVNISDDDLYSLMK